MKNTELEQLKKKTEEIIVDCLITGETEREASKVTYGNPNYWIDQIMALFQSHEVQIKQDIFKKVEGLIEEAKPEPRSNEDFMKSLRCQSSDYTYGHSRGFKIGIDEYGRELRSSLKALEEELL